ncbi:putative ATPase/DNA-binding winged helix-turn-helix (wHTH) protein [Rhizobium azooxidifex]|uniref:Putative ATPase/DNA-binding winged helix-turn-helix (WHTH) protein n=1 Tax=Mycoplana azooxidifex TaxID=1636188 RepID=A0A7W6GLS3_9HYPH|nr:winged helix-turn-helix domain-containing protein [Mycoplana azooxidifex]MBB3979712.1 putative ATPase/DNA-binding winged helix-turn-helix (wHTH) protein [Mycoplana azooxidifex]
MAVIKFGTFELDLVDKKLTESGRPYQLGKKALELLVALVSNAGEIVSKEELMRAAWPTTTVDEGALRVHLLTLRKALGEYSEQRYIENIAGRGYVFVAPVELSVTDSGTLALAPDTNLPRFASHLIGREEFIATSVTALASTRLLTISGAGGIGKTAVALEMAARIQASRRVVFVDLAVLKDGRLLMPTLASLLGLVLYTNDYRQAVLNSLHSSDILLLFDNCEHLIETVAVEVDQILKATARVSILATSREPLRVAGERVRKLPSLHVPDFGMSTQELLSIPSVELFVESVKLASDLENFGDEESLQAAAAIVRSLDGIPLAIELAASRVSSLGLKSVLGSLGDPLSILRRGRRTAPPRQQTLRATLDWSHDSLNADERELFATIAVFPGTFSDHAAEFLVRERLSGERFDNAFDGLLLKSLIAVSSADGRYRLLDTTKGYALEKLAAGAFEAASRFSHARYCREELLRAEADWRGLPTGDWLTRYATLINDLRAAIEWASAPQGDLDLAVELVAISNTVWVQLGAMNEQLIAVEGAIGHLPSTRHPGTDVELQLRIARGSALYHIGGFRSDQEASAEFERAAVIAEQLGNPGRIMRAYGGMASVASSKGLYLRSIAIATDLQRRFPGALSYSRLLEHNYLFHGDLKSSREQADLSLFEASRAVRTTQNYGTGYDQGTIARSVITMIDFLEGNIDRSLSGIEELIVDCEKLGHSISTCLMLCLSAIPIAYLAGQIETARAKLDAVKRIAGKDMLVRWQEWAGGYDLVVPQDTQTQEMQATLQQALQDGVGMRLEYMTVLAGCRASPAALDRALAGDAGWCRPELLRLKAVSLIKRDGAQARSMLIEAIDLARSIGAVMWELRCAICLVRLAEPGKAASVMGELASVLKRVDSNRPIPDLEIARALLAARDA